jgi:2-dehydro-3-deoxygalactonokinase
MALIAVDWGTTNCRAYRTDGAGAIQKTYSSALGITSVAPGAYPGVLTAIRAALGADAPVLIAGMAGSNRGWAEAPYAAAPAAVLDVARLAIPAPGERRARLLPGVRMAAPHASDVMRGEETQIFGAEAADGVLCLPGTHTKWARVASGAIVRFQTAMAGEVYHLLRTQSILAGSLSGGAAAAEGGEGFLEGVAAAQDGRFLHAAFSLRPRSLLDGRDARWCEDFLSGLVIGSDVREAGLAPGTAVTILGADALARLYALALRAGGHVPIPGDGAQAFARGAARIARHIVWEEAR